MDLIRIIFKENARNGDILRGKITKKNLSSPNSMFRANRMRRAGLDIDNNYCHNSFGEGTKPWCYFKSNDRLAQEWGYCDIPTCEQFCGSTISSTAYMTSNVSPKPTDQGLKRKDPFVTCWNKCYQTGPLNGPKCMDNCIRVS